MAAAEATSKVASTPAITKASTATAAPRATVEAAQQQQAGTAATPAVAAAATLQQWQEGGLAAASSKKWDTSERNPSLLQPSLQLLAPMPASAPLLWVEAVPHQPLPLLALPTPPPSPSPSAPVPLPPPKATTAAALQQVSAHAVLPAALATVYKPRKKWVVLVCFDRQQCHKSNACLL